MAVMTGRDLILYILANNLEDKPVFDKGKFIGFVTASDVAVKTNVGLATVHAWIHQGRLDSVAVNEGIYIPANYRSPMCTNTV
jgi:predicted transcriptional regulator